MMDDKEDTEDTALVIRGTRGLMVLGGIVAMALFGMIFIQANCPAAPVSPTIPSAAPSVTPPPAPLPLPPLPKLRTPIEQGMEDAGARLVIRGDVGHPGWWYGAGRPTGACVTGSLYTRTDLAGLFVCGSMGWIDALDEREER